MEPQPTSPQQLKNPPIEFKPREFLLGLAVGTVIIFAVAGTRWYVRARTTASVSSCYAHLKQLQDAKDTWALDHQKRGHDVPNWSDIVGRKAYIGLMPICPRGGTYTLGPVEESPRCSIPDHILP